MLTSYELRTRSLPKWLACRITGTPVTVEQALEIIRRTDCYIGSLRSNDKKFTENFKRMFNITDDSGLTTKDKMEEYFDAL